MSLLAAHVNNLKLGMYLEATIGPICGESLLFQDSRYREAEIWLEVVSVCSFSIFIPFWCCYLSAVHQLVWEISPFDVFMFLSIFMNIV